MQDALINFRVSATERQRLRILLLQEGTTLQEFFAGVLRQKLAEAPAPEPHVSLSKGQKEDWRLTRDWGEKAHA